MIDERLNQIFRLAMDARVLAATIRNSGGHSKNDARALEELRDALHATAGMALDLQTPGVSA